ncbi:MAG: type IV pilus modification protein PilV [Pseudomonadota bacterium]
MLNTQSQRGFTMVEALVTVLIFAIGLLGVIGLQTLALSSTSISNQRGDATVLALDMADRMRANLGAVVTGVGTGYDVAVPASNACRDVYANATAVAGVCTSAQLAADDLYDWQAQIQQTLPNGGGTVCIDRVTTDGAPGAPVCDGLGVSYVIYVWWTQQATQNVTAAVQQFAMVVRP